jgi:ATP-dependent helicase/nuclease subunit B
VYASGEQRRWLVEAALTQINDPTNPLYPDGEPTVGLVEQAMELLTLLEFAGIDSPETVRERLKELGLHQLAKPLSTFFQYVLAIREEVFESGLTFRSERYLHSIRHGPDIISEILDTTDVVVVGALQTLSPLERDLLDQLASVFDTAVVFPRVTDSPSPTGVDQAVSRLAQWYESIGFDTVEGAKRIDSVGHSPRDRLAHSLYRYEHPADQSVELSEEISVHSYRTIRHEVAGLAREIRSLIADGLSPEQICVAVYDEDTYTELLAQQLDRAGVPVTYDTQRLFFETTTGGLFEAVLDLGTDPDRQDPLVRLLSNPLVMPE